MSNEKKEVILLPHNYLKFVLVKIIISKIALLNVF